MTEYQDSFESFHSDSRRLTLLKSIVSGTANSSAGQRVFEPECRLRAKFARLQMEADSVAPASTDGGTVCKRRSPRQDAAGDLHFFSRFTPTNAIAIERLIALGQLDANNSVEPAVGQSATVAGNSPSPRHSRHNRPVEPLVYAFAPAFHPQNRAM